MREVEVTNERLASIWWALVWRQVVGGVLLFVFLAFVSAFLFGFGTVGAGAARILDEVLLFVAQLGIVFLALQGLAVDQVQG